MSRRGENIRKRKDGRWEGRYIKGYDSKKQKARYASVYGKTYAETKQKLDEAKYKSSIGVVYVDAKNKLFGEIINSWFNAKKINLKPSSIIKYQNLIEKHILPELGHRKLRELNADLFYTFLDAQQKNGNKKNGGMLSTSSLQTMLYILNATIKYAASNNMVAYFSICLTRSGKEATPIQTLEQHEEDALDLFLSTHISRRNLGIMLSLYCGLRIGEVCALQWTDIDTKNAILYVRRTVQRIAHSSGKTKTKIHVGSPKSKSSIRVIPIPSFLVPIICTLAQEDPPDAYILTGSINKPLEPRTFQYYFDQVLTMAGIQKTNYHTLRHTFATNCVALGFDINRIALEWAQKAAKLGDPLGMECLAVIYDDGIDVYRNPMQAAHWYREVLNHEPENTFCMYRLAVCLADPFEEFNLHPGYGMLEEAYFWACKGVEKGDLDCHMLVAWFYEMGNVVNQDYDMAYKYFRIAADNGHEMSAELIKRYRKNIFGNYYIPQ